MQPAVIRCRIVFREKPGAAGKKLALLVCELDDKMSIRQRERLPDAGWENGKAPSLVMDEGVVVLGVRNTGRIVYDVWSGYMANAINRAKANA